MAWPLTPLTTYVPTTTPAIKGSDLNSFQSAINGLYNGTLTMVALTLDGSGAQSNTNQIPGSAIVEGALSVGALMDQTSGLGFTAGSGGAAQFFYGANSVSAPVTMALPDVLTVPGPMWLIVIKDNRGNASVNNITVSPHGTQKIDGVNTSKVISSNYGVLRLAGYPTVGAIQGWWTW